MLGIKVIIWKIDQELDISIDFYFKNTQTNKCDICGRKAEIIYA